MSSESRKTYPGRTFVQVAQIVLMVAIAAFAFSAVTRSQSSPDTADTSEAAPGTSEAMPRTSEAAPATPRMSEALRPNNESVTDNYTWMIEQNPTDPDAWLLRGVYYERKGDHPALSRRDLWQYVQLMETKRVTRSLSALRSPKTLSMQEGRVYALRFGAQAGEMLTVSALSVVTGQVGTEGISDPLLIVVNENGEAVHANNDTLNSDGRMLNMNARLTYAVKTSGVYTLILTHAGGGSTGEVQVQVSLR